ncbi:unnamed protein product [Arctia plantaginis]|uniref:Uncharacterized protein n=1 Tax=Arctia plantaginis TaxID=874455 RepID=A0A8S1AJ18_ARCPL|nr:unnamed protein product [Arctia plantaginis]
MSTKRDGYQLLLSAADLLSDGENSRTPGHLMKRSAARAAPCVFTWEVTTGTDHKMKVIAALALLVAAISALPSTQIDERNARLDIIVIDYITKLGEAIRARGLDPFHLRRESTSIALPGGRIFKMAGLVEDVKLDGLSNIVINSVNFDAFSGIVSFDLQMPSIVGSVGHASGALQFFNQNAEAEGSGRLAVTNARVSGFVSVAFGIAGVVATDAHILASIENIESDISLHLQVGHRDYDLGQYLNSFLNDHLLPRLEAFQNEINQLIAIYLLRNINRF